MQQGMSIVIPLSASLHQKSRVMALIQNQKFEQEVDTEFVLVSDVWSEKYRKEFLEQCSRPGVILRFITEFRPAYAFARESGIRAATYDIVALIEPDLHLRPSVLSAGYKNMADHPELGACVGSIEPVGKAGLDVPCFCEFKFAEMPDNHLLLLGIMFIRKQAWQSMYEKGFFLHLPHVDLSISEGRELMWGIEICGWRIAFDNRLSCRLLTFNQQLSVRYQLQGKADPLLDCYRLMANGQGDIDFWWQEFFQTSRFLLQSLRSWLTLNRSNKSHARLNIYRRFNAWITVLKLYSSLGWHSRQIKLFSLRAKSSERQMKINYFQPGAVPEFLPVPQG